jgi:hypothetical protein
MAYDTRPAEQAVPDSGQRPTAIRNVAPDLGPTTIDGLGNRKGALGDSFQRGVYDPDGRFNPAQRDVADRLAGVGAAVHALGPNGVGPDAMVRWKPDDPGRLTTFRFVAPGAADGFVEKIMRDARPADQHVGGDLVVDARMIDLDEVAASRQYDIATKVAAMQGQPNFDSVHFLLDDAHVLSKDWNPLHTPPPWALEDGVEYQRARTQS